MPEERITIALRVSAEERAEVRRRAGKLKVSLPMFIRRSLGLSDPRPIGRPPEESVAGRDRA